MTAEADTPLVVDTIEPTFEVKAQQTLTVPEHNMLIKYISAGKHPLAPDTIASLFQLYISGSDCSEIHRLNKSFPFEAILWARVKYDWDRQRDNYIMDLQDKIRDKVVMSQCLATELMADLLTATMKKNGDKIKKFIQTGNEADLGDALRVSDLKELLKVAEGLQKITGQDRVHKLETKSTQSLSVSVGTAGGGDISPEGAAKMLAILADEKRKKK